MLLFATSFAILVISVSAQERINVTNICPQIQCPNDVNIPTECRKAQFVIGSDHQTACRVCDTSICGPLQEVCPAIYCPGDKILTEVCRRPNFVIGSDGITKCRVCDSSICDAIEITCPQLQCLEQQSIPPNCRLPQNSIGLDGITVCRICDANGCVTSTEAAPAGGGAPVKVPPNPAQ